VTELELRIGAARALEECYRRGLVLRWRGPLPGHPGGQRWRLGLPGRSDSLELNQSGSHTWVALGNRAPEPVQRVARELARL
jgi:hypothetical protein